MKSNPPSNLCAIPQPIGAKLTELAPSVVFSVSRSIDSYYSWNGDGPDPRDSGFDPCNVDVTACTIIRGQVIEETDSLGGSYFRHDEPTGDIHGYLPQMLEQAAFDLAKRVGVAGSPTSLELSNVIAYLRKYRHERYEEEQAKK